ncbi:MAG: T9SS type A sorting domain-containing protein [Melioribacter sp.]|nr:T9SS type A sorting domain-containing protein [Melioribacter sp.]
MLKIYNTLGGKIGSMIILLIVSFLFLVPQQIKADGKVEVTGSVQVKTDSSITVNNMEFLVTASTQIRGSMDSTLSFDSLKVGNFVRVEGETGASGTLVASKIRLMTTNIHLELHGKITALTTNSLTVNGNEVFVDTNTIIFTQFHAALSFADLKVGDSVLVKAAQSTGGQLTAVAIIVMTGNTRQEIELEGKIQVLTSNSIKVNDVEFFVDSSTIILSHDKGILLFSDLKVGDDVEVRGFLRQDSTYLALYIRVENEEFETKELEVEGTISAIDSTSLTVNMIVFKVDSSTVIYAHDGAVLSFSELKIGDRVEVKAILLGDSTYKATRIKLENVDSENELEVAGLIDVVNSDNFLVGGYQIFVNSQTKIYNQFKQSISFADLTAGTFVVVKASLQSGVYYASLIKVRANNNADLNVTGAIEVLGGSTITVKGVVFLTDQNTEFADNNKNTITYIDLKVGQIVTVKATLNGNQYYAFRVTARTFWRPTVIVEGTIENLTLSSITVMGKTFAVDSSTLVVGHGTGVITFASLTLGLQVEVKGALNTSGVLTAKLIKVHPDHEFEVFGKIDSLSGSQFFVAGLTFKTDLNTVYYDEFDNAVTFDSLKVNQFVEVTYVKTVLNENLAVKVEIENDPHSVQFNGVVTGASSSNIRLSIPSFSINSNTVFISSTYTPVQSTSIQVGQSVTVWAEQDQNGNLKAVQVQQISSSVTAVNNKGDQSVPVAYELKQNYPNPFNPSTDITFTLEKQEVVSLVVYNIIGQEVATLVSGPMSAGSHIVKFNASKLTSGVYLYRLKAGNFVAVKKMLLLK